MPKASTEVFEEIKETVIGHSLVDYQEWCQTKADRVKDYDLVLIQGSEYFVSEAQKWFDSWKLLTVFGVVPCHGAASKCGEFLCDKSWTSPNFIRVNHVQTGGITCGQWKIYGDLKLTGLKSSPVKRVLHHLVDTTEMGPEISDHNLIRSRVSQGQRIPSYQKHIRVAVSCCFMKDKNALVDRDLSDRELLAAYNIEEGVQQSLLQHAKHQGKRLSQSFVMEAPVKVLYLVSKLILKACTNTVNGNPDVGRDSVVKEPFLGS